METWHDGNPENPGLPELLNPVCGMYDENTDNIVATAVDVQGADKMSIENKFKIGDAVTHKTGGPNMIVIGTKVADDLNEEVLYFCRCFMRSESGKWELPVKHMLFGFELIRCDLDITYDDDYDYDDDYERALDKM